MADSRQQIMEATYTVLCREGYADLSIRKIADEAGKDKSLIYHHYDNKKGLILGFLESMEESIIQEQVKIDSTPKEEKLDKLIDISLGINDSERWEFQKAFLELQAQASHDKDLAKKLRDLDKLILQNIIQIFKELEVQNPKSTAEMFICAAQGAVNRKVSARDKEGLKNLKEEIKTIVSQRTPE